MTLQSIRKFACLPVLTVLLLGAGSGATRAASDDAAKYIPIQHNGRVKSFDAYSRQTLELITGRQKWNGKPAVMAALEAIQGGDSFKKVPWIRVDYKELIAFLGLPVERHFFSYEEIIPSTEKIESLVKSAKENRDKDLRPSKLEQKAESLYGSLIEAGRLMSGESVKVIPPTQGSEAWTSPYETPSKMGGSFKGVLESFTAKKPSEFNNKIEDWNSGIHGLTANAYRTKIGLEVHYLSLRPFEWAWIAYLFSFILLSFFKKSRQLRWTGIVLLAGAMLFHTYGLVLRVLILSRPPVSNMYESVVYMNWVLMFAAVIFAAVRKNLSLASVGALLSAIIMVYGDLLPIDTSLEVLVPVLRSNYWLSIHVMTIVSSYGVLGLAMGLGHRHLILDARKKLSKTENEKSALLILRVIQVGMLLLGIGTVLGGVWANESWGRFWGWDPKETWALITFLGYLIVIHLKYAKKISNFWLAMSAMLGFLLVLMTWYGVNFVLGRGLHSYGQGSGGMRWVILYLVLETAFVGFILERKRTKSPRRSE